MKSTWRWVLLLCSLAVAGCAVDQPAHESRMPQLAAGEHADLILTNGKIVTVDDRFTIAQAVAIKGGRVVAVGASADIGKLGGASTKTMDLRGRTVIPG